MKSNPTTASPITSDALKIKVGEENQTVCQEERKKGLRDMILSLNHKLEELSRINERFFQMIDSSEKREFDSDDENCDSSSKEIPLPDPLSNPRLVYRLSYIMDFLKQTLDFNNWGIFLLTENNSNTKKVVSSSESMGNELFSDFEEKIKNQWESGDIKQAMIQQKRLVFSKDERDFLIVPFKILDDQEGFWALQFDEGVSLEMKSSADLLFGVDLVAACLENSCLNQSSFSLSEEKSNRMEKEKFLTVVELSGAMVHEINNSLQIILGRTQIFRMSKNKSPETASSTAIWETIEENANRICSTLKNFSDFLHRQSEGLTVQQLDKLTVPERNQREQSRRTPAQEVNLQHILESNIVLLKYILKSTGIQLEVEHKDDLPTVCGDPGELELACLSFIRGIRDFLPSGGSICLKTFPEKDSLCLSLHCAGNKGEKDNYPDWAEFQNHAQLKLVSQILENQHGGLQFEDRDDGEKRFVLRFPMA